ncbi:ubiquitin-protein ligase E3 [Schizosaccharomyces japonicus yFS275]|uniref:Ubiquitin-protein ligase E3 n=1 Tax=Schizosaccharomyces japonicus (strain yFS275 / FY16936) TaxID=402676 RepID=B6K563_SCHJY|nr:ubiquitin-protein ligase E3 [Schizosaccharomyces japonicus yFS275]EEB08667.1 ubiquitin-protein ligase E3 [Schizosaccharomyces japonicus yFS275]
MGQYNSIPSSPARSRNESSQREEAAEHDNNIVSGSRVRDRHSNGSRGLWNRILSFQRYFGLSSSSRQTQRYAHSNDNRQPFRSALNHQRSSSMRSLSPRNSRMNTDSTSRRNAHALLSLQSAQQDFEHAERRFRDSIYALYEPDRDLDARRLRHQQQRLQYSSAREPAEVDDHTNPVMGNDSMLPTSSEIQNQTNQGDNAWSRVTSNLFNSTMQENQPERISLQPGENQMAILSRLLSVFASATASTLINSDNNSTNPVNSNNGFSEPSVNLDNAEPGETRFGDESFEQFLLALREGRLIDAMHSDNDTGHGPAAENFDENNPATPLNFFRVFRFDNTRHEEAGQREVPVIIVAVRAVQPTDAEATPSNVNINSTRPSPMEEQSDAQADQQQLPSSSSDENNGAYSSIFPQSSSTGLQGTQPNGSLESDEAAVMSEVTDEGYVSRSWVIYIIGANYPENHPLLSAPSLFTDSPTYEDMLLLNSMLGTVKPSIATQQDMDRAGGVFTVSTSDERCLVCLSEFQNGEECRRLQNCKHFFHRECIDQWLTTSQNSCPLCRMKGVNVAESTTVPTP